MLRLRPSELTLTAEDVEETFRRIARRQAARSSTNATSRHAESAGRPVLRRGPQRAVRDAITTLGDIPILRPQPQQAIPDCVNEDAEEHLQHEPPTSPVRDDVRSDAQAGQVSLTTVTSTTSTLRRLHLPFRLGRSRRDSVTNPTSDEEDGQAAHRTDANNSDHVEASMDGSSGSTRHRKTPSESRRRLSLRSPAELRGGYRSKREHTTDSSDEATPNTRHEQAMSVPARSSNTENASLFPPADAAPGTVYLRGRPADRERDPAGVTYTFDEFRMLPQTEPRPPRQRRRLFSRSLSSGSAPRNTSQVSRTRPSGRVDEDLFGPAEPGRVLRSNAQRMARSSQLSSEASNTTAAFSLYELPSESRASSSGYSGSGMQSYDGTSTAATGGGYRSIRASNVVAGSSREHAEARPTPAITNRGNVSSRSTSSNLDPMSRVFVPQSGHLSAATAAIQDLPSPLQPFSEHYQQLERSRSSTPVTQFGFPLYAPHQNHPPTRTFRFSHSTTNSLPYQSPYAAPHLSTEQLPLADGPYRQAPHLVRSSQCSSENAPVGFSSGGSRPHSSQVQTHREAYERMHHAQQALEEAARFMPTPPSLPRDTFNRPRTMAAAMGSSPPVRQPPQQQLQSFSSSPPQFDGPGADTLQSHHLSSTSATIPTNPTNFTNMPAPPAYRLGSPSAPMPTNIPHHPFSTQAPFGTHPRAYHAHNPLAPPIRLTPNPSHPFAPTPRDPVRPPTRIAPVRAPVSIRPHRRVPPQQRDQENSGVAEESLMRREEAGVAARYGEEEGGEVMDETPPRVGRVERMMMRE